MTCSDGYGRRWCFTYRPSVYSTITLQESSQTVFLFSVSGTIKRLLSIYIWIDMLGFDGIKMYGMVDEFVSFIFSRAMTEIRYYWNTFLEYSAVIIWCHVNYFALSPPPPGQLRQLSCKPLGPACANPIVVKIKLNQRWALPQHSCKTLCPILHHSSYIFSPGSRLFILS